MGHVLIVGGGIAGLALGAALGRAGVDYSIHEQAPELRDVGAGIALWPNALRALDRIGLAAEMLALGGNGADTELRRWDGRVLVRQRAVDLTERWGWPTVGARRSELQTQLLSVVDPAAVHLGRRLTKVDEDATGVTLEFADGATARGEVVVGADGLRSVVRQVLVGDGPPRSAGTVGWLAVSSTRVPVMFETIGPGRKVGGLPHSSHGLWFASAVVDDAGEEDAEQLPILARLFEDWHDPIPTLIATTDEAMVIRRPVFIRRRLRRWAAGRIAVIGDAAHPMVPDLGQGGCQALEDAIVFADHLVAASKEGRRLEVALADAAAARRRRAARTAATARLFGWATHQRHPLAQRVAQLALASPPTGLRLRQLEWILGPAERRGTRSEATSSEISTG